MGPLDLLLHFTNFAAAALFLALLLALVARFFWSKAAPASVFVGQLALNFIVGLAVLLAGLWFFGRDGKMATYAALVLAMATAQWLGAKAWRR